MSENVEHVNNNAKTIKLSDEEWRSLAETIIKVIHAYATMEALSALLHALLCGCDPNIVYMDLRETSFTKMLIKCLSDIEDGGDGG
ncbi:MAG: hypothetical protein QXX12_05960, partial [Nanopusillaceae archaeon]